MASDCLCGPATRDVYIHFFGYYCIVVVNVAVYHEREKIGKFKRSTVCTLCMPYTPVIDSFCNCELITPHFRHIGH